MRSITFIKAVLILALAMLFSVPAVAQPKPEKKKKQPVAIDYSKLPAAADQKNVTYETHIKPILDASCTRCHGEEKPKGRLRLDSLDGVFKGSEHKKVVAPGDAKASPLLVHVARIGDPDEFMPPTNNKAGIQPLTTEKVSLIRAWIEQGAK
jgi:uncharacterized membrane protein